MGFELIRVSDEVAVELRTRRDAANERGYDAVIRIALGMPARARSRGGFPAVKYAMLERLNVGEEYVLAWIRKEGSTEAVNADALAVGVAKVESKMRFKFLTKGTPHGLLVRRIS